MKKKLCVYIILAFIVSIAFGQDMYEPVPLVVGFDTQIWRGLNDIRTISKGETVYPYNGAYLYDSINGQDYIVDIDIDIGNNNRRYYILANALVPASGDTLPESWLTPVDAPKKWIISYYLNVLRTGNRDAFFKYERPWMEHTFELIASDQQTNIPYTWDRWFEEMDILRVESLIFNTAGLIIGGFQRCSFFMHTITPFESGYRITVSSDRSFTREVNIPFETRLPFPRYSERKVFDLIFIPDGDYMDVYLDSKDTKLASFAKVDSVFITEIENLFRTNTYDISKLTSWPRRANGSMDYPPSVDMSSYKTTHHTTDNLRLRDTPNTSSLMVTTLSKGSAVQVLETGEMQIIDGITAPWVKVLSESEYVGWCFSGYLEEVAKPEPVAAVDTISDEVAKPEPVAVVDAISSEEPHIEPITRNSAEEKTVPLWVLIAIISAAVVLVGGVVLFIVKRKK